MNEITFTRITLTCLEERPQYLRTTGGGGGGSVLSGAKVLEKKRSIIASTAIWKNFKILVPF